MFVFLFIYVFTYSVLPHRDSPLYSNRKVKKKTNKKYNKKNKNKPKQLQINFILKISPWKYHLSRFKMSQHYQPVDFVSTAYLRVTPRTNWNQLVYEKFLRP